MKVFSGTFVTWIGFHVQRMVCVVMVVVVLRMHCQMRHLTGALRHRHRAKHRHRLPQKDNQKEECAQANRHAGDFSHVTAQSAGELRESVYRLPATAPTAQALRNMARFIQDNGARTHRLKVFARNDHYKQGFQVSQARQCPAAQHFAGAGTAAARRQFPSLLSGQVKGHNTPDAGVTAH